MNTKRLIDQELYRISKHIKTVLNNDPDSDEDTEIRKAVEVYELTIEEEIKLIKLLR